MNVLSNSKGHTQQDSRDLDLIVCGTFLKRTSRRKVVRTWVVVSFIFLHLMDIGNAHVYNPDQLFDVKDFFWKPQKDKKKN